MNIMRGRLCTIFLAYVVFLIGPSSLKGQDRGPLDPCQHLTETAARWSRLAAEGEYPPAQYNLAKMYCLADGVPKNKTEDVEWFKKAAELGDAVAQVKLGLRYRDGKGVSQEDRKSVV